MTKKIPSNKAPFTFNGKIIDVDKSEKRRVIKLLPGIHQTETLQKFFGASADSLFEPGKSKPINGYIGKKPSYYNSQTENYVSEKDASRQFYQLTPAMISKDIDGNTTNTLVYTDLLNQLRFQGGMVNNHNRLFNDNFYTWCPPFDLDKFVNFREYFWLPQGPEITEVYGHKKTTKGDGTTTVFRLATNRQQPSDAFIKVFVDGVLVPFTYGNDSDFVILNSAPSLGSTVDVYSASDIRTELNDVSVFNFDGELPLTSNMRIRINNDIDINNNGKIFLVEGVGEDIILVEDDNPNLSLSADYMVIARGSRDGSPWSKGNRWFHRTVVGAMSPEVRDVVQAKRPIIEFDRDLELFNYGSIRRESVDLVYSDTDFIDSVNGKSQITIDGITIDNNSIEDYKTVLVVGDLNSVLNNRVYKIFVDNNDLLYAELYASGSSPIGAPIDGEVLRVSTGSVYGGMEMYFDFEEWVPAQEKSSANHPPLFQLYDYSGNKLNDEAKYPGNSFRGSKIIGYKVDSTLSKKTDKYLGIRLVHTTSGEIVFENFINTEKYSYVVNTIDTTIDGYYYHSTGGVLSNDWYLNNTKSKQYVVDDFIADGSTRLFNLSQEPATNDDIIVTKNGEVLSLGQDYLLNNNNILITTIKKDDIVEAKTFNTENKPDNTTGHYELPMNLTANPKLEVIGDFSINEVYDQFTEIMNRQSGFTGSSYASNNYKDTKKQKNLGSKIIQHESPLLKTMLLASDNDLDFMKASQYAEKEYARFKSKFDKKIQEYMVLGLYDASDDINIWVDSALRDISKDFTADFPFYLSGMGVTETNSIRHFIPATPAYLGLTPSFNPRIEMDNNIVPPSNVIVGHDGSRIVCTGDIRDQAMLELEKRFYNSIPQIIKNNERQVFDVMDYVSGKFRHNEYSVAEFKSVIRPSFERWCSSNNINYKNNTTFDISDPFSWNWSSTRDKDNKALPGHWRGIFELFYDTYRPHTHPWEMLGFSSRPTWWNARYGTAPYTSGNVILWNDLEHGRIFEGPRKTNSDKKWSRPGLSEIIPVDEQGNLLDPNVIGIATSRPTPSNAMMDWKFGDLSPIEFAWKRSFWYPFALSQTMYLLKPATFIERTWKTLDTIEVLDGINKQRIDSLTGMRGVLSSEYVHNEKFGDTVIYRHGSQQWISDYLKSKNKDITVNFGSRLRGLDTVLSYKVGGFTKSENLSVVSDSFDRLPQEDVSVELYRSPSIREEVYSGVIVEYTGQNWRVYGYDTVNPYFKVLRPDYSGKNVSVSSGITRKTNIPAWRPDVYYTIHAVIRYDNKFYRCLRTHTSGRSFEDEYWRQVARPEFSDTSSVDYYTETSDINNYDIVPYGSYIRTPQQFANFISGYSMYLESKGWVFDTLTDDNDISDWRMTVKRFLSWITSTNNPIKEGSFLVLSPASNKVKFVTDFGAIQPVEQIINGVYSILDKSGQPIQPEATNVIRNDNDITIFPNSTTGIFATRLYISEVEHIILINNKTIFNDVVYSPLYNISQPRLRLIGYKTTNWRGRIDAPGFIISGNTIIPNFEKSADDFRRFFEIETSDIVDLQERARNNVGYRERKYLSNLLLTSTNQFEFYQGMIQQKGTGSVFKRLLRSNFIRHNDGIKFLEEWAFRIGQYGASRIHPSLDIKLHQDEVKNDPQLIRFNAGIPNGLNVDTQTKVSFQINGINEIVLVNGGSGYKSIPKVIVNNATGDNGSMLSLEAVMDWSQSAIQSVSVLSGGSGFFSGDELVAVGSGENAYLLVNDVDLYSSKITNVQLTRDSGSVGTGVGYSVGDLFVVNGGNGRGRLRVDQVGQNGEIIKLVVTNQGGNYNKNPSVTSLSGNNTANDNINVVTSGGSLISVDVVSGGYGYDDKTYIQFTANGKNANCVVNISGGSVEKINIKNHGSGYIQSPTITFSGVSTMPASANAIIANGEISLEKKIRDFDVNNSVVIEKIVVNVHTGFNGSQPTISIGDDLEKNRYMRQTNIGQKRNIVTEFDFNNPITNTDNEIKLFVDNINSDGNLDVTVFFKLLPSYFSSYVTDYTDDNVIDLYDVIDPETNKKYYKDGKWLWRPDTLVPDWSKKYFDQKEKGFLPNAGYVKTDQVDWYANDWDEFIGIFFNTKESFPPNQVDNNITISYENNLSASYEKKYTLLNEVSTEVYKVKNIVVNVTEPFISDNTGSPTLKVGFMNDKDKFIKTNEIDLTEINNHNISVYEFIDNNQLDNGSIYAYFDQGTAYSYAPGKLDLSIYIEEINDSIIPTQRVWCYDTGIGEWDVFRLGDTSLVVKETFPPIYDNQGTIVSVNKNIFDTMNIVHDTSNPTSSVNEAEARLSKIVLDSIVDNDGTLNGVMNAKISNKRNLFLNTSSLSNSFNNNVKILDLFEDTGIFINTITVSIVKPFVNGNPTLTIGTNASNDRFVRSVVHDGSVTPTAISTPRFSYDTEITVDIFDTEMITDEPNGTSNINMRLTRSGNVFATPASINVVNGGWGYSKESTPNVTVIGPTGVLAKANLTGTIVGFMITNGGYGYTSNPDITIIGGEGSGASATASITGDKVTNIAIAGTGTGSNVNAIISGGKVVGFNIISAGYGWTKPPIIKLSGGNPARHANATAILNGSGGIASITLNDGGSGYVGTPTVSLLPSTGAGYSTEPRVIVSGGNGSGATVEPVMLWSVESITITDWGKCSWSGGVSQIIVDAPNGGAAPVAQLIQEPSVLSPTTINQYRYKVSYPTNHPNYGQWVNVNNTVTFVPPNGVNSPNFWLQNIQIPVSSYEEQVKYDVEIPEFVHDANGNPTVTPNIVNGVLGTNTATLTVLNTIEGTTDIDLSKQGTKTFNINQLITETDELLAFFNSDDNSGLVTISVDYHYTTGFELTFLDGNAVTSNTKNYYGNVLNWSKMRFDQYDDLFLKNNVPSNGWQQDDIVFIDDGRNHTEKASLWTSNGHYSYSDLVQYDGKIYRSIIGSNGAEIDFNIESGIITTIDVKEGGLYTTDPTVHVNDITGYGAILTSRLKPTKIHSIRVLNGGYGYSVNEPLSITNKYGNGDYATARVSSVDANGTITSVSIINRGTGFDSSPIVEVINDNRIGMNKATFEAIMEPVGIDKIIIVNGGSNYSSDSDVIIENIENSSITFDHQTWEPSFESKKLWKTYNFDKGQFVSSNIEEEKVNSDLVEVARIYDLKKNETKQIVQMFDPYKGIIPGIIKKEISYILEYDPAVYSVGYENAHFVSDNTWGDNQVGQVWWNIRTTKYIDYEQGDINYKWQNWGKLCPGVQIEVYEWTKSKTSPYDWSETVSLNSSEIQNDGTPSGTVKDIDQLPAWVEKEEYNKETGVVETFYYFWVRNSTVLPKRNTHREMTTYQIANALFNPQDSGIPWFAVIDSNQLIVGGVKEYLDENSVLTVEWKTSNNDGVDHKEWVLMREGDERNNINVEVYDKMVNSLVGWDNLQSENVVNTSTLSIINPSSTSVELQTTDGLSNSGELKVGDYWISYSWIDGNTVHGLKNIGNLTFQIGTQVSQTTIIDTPKVLPDPWLSEVESYGSAIRPAQSWFMVDVDSNGNKKTSRLARRTLIDTLNNIFSREPIIDTRLDWESVFIQEDNISNEKLYNYKVSDIFERNQLVNNNIIKKGQTVLVESTIDSQGFWTVWKYNPDNSTSDINGFTLDSAQKWRLQNGELWTPVDWYADGFSENDYPIKRFRTRAERDAAPKMDVTLLKGTLVHVDTQDQFDTRWSWSIYTEDGWREVAKEKATIRLSDQFWKSNILYGFDNFVIRNILTRDGSNELKFMMEQFKTKVLTKLERNELFFSMVHFAQSQNVIVDWMFKTSFLYIGGYSEQLQQTPVVTTDQIDNLIEYIEEVKPYHVKIRDYVRRLSVPIDIANLHLTDFDKPVWYDENINGGTWRKLDNTNVVDNNILATSKDHVDWFNNYQKKNTDLNNWDANWNPIRRPSITMLFDRISCKPNIGWDTIGIPWDAIEERYRGLDNVVSYKIYEDSYRKFSKEITTWQDFYPDYEVTIVVPEIFEVVKNGISYFYVDLAKTTENIPVVANELLVLVDINNNTKISSVWRRKSTSDTFEPFVYRYQNVRNVIERDNLVRESEQHFNNGLGRSIQTGDIVRTSYEDKNFMWTGTEWKEFWGTAWDKSWGGGLADRISEHYEPTLGMKRDDLGELIRGCGYKGTVVDGGTIGTGLWDRFSWDNGSGFDNEYAHFMGHDTEINPTIVEGVSLNKLENNWRLDEEGREYLEANTGRVYRIDENDHRSVDENGNIIDVYGYADIVVDGGNIINPFLDEGHPDELVKTRINNSLMITVYQKQNNNSIPSISHGSAFRLFKNAQNKWEKIYLEDNGITLASDVRYMDREIKLSTPTGVEIFDPENPTDVIFEKVSPLNVFTYTDGTIKNTTIGEYNIVWNINELINQKIKGPSSPNDVSLITSFINEMFPLTSKVWMVGNKIRTSDDALYDISTANGKMSGTVMEVIFSGNDVVIKINIDNIINVGDSIHWSVIPHNTIRTDGVIWINNERVTYRNIEVNGTETTLKNTKRGSGGTSSAVKDDKVVMLHSANNSTTNFSIPTEWNGDINQLVVSVLRFDDNQPYMWTNLYNNVDYTINGSTVIFKNPPAQSINGSYPNNVKIEVVRENWKSSNVVHKSGDVVFIGNPMRTLPLGEQINWPYNDTVGSLTKRMNDHGMIMENGEVGPTK